VLKSYRNFDACKVWRNFDACKVHISNYLIGRKEEKINVNDLLLFEIEKIKMTHVKKL